MAFHNGFNIFNESLVNSCSRVFGQQSYTFRDSAAGRSWRTQYSYRQLFVLNHDFGSSPHTCKQQAEVPGCFSVRNVDYMVSHMAIIEQ